MKNKTDTLEAKVRKYATKYLVDTLIECEVGRMYAEVIGRKGGDVLIFRMYLKNGEIDEDKIYER